MRADRLRTLIFFLRVIHGFVLTNGILDSGGFLVSVFLNAFARDSHPNPAGYFLLYTGLLVSQLAIAWFAWLRFHQCSPQTALLLYGLWLIFFVLQGWFTTWATYSLHEFVMTSEGTDGSPRFPTGACVSLLSNSILPILRFICSHRAGGDTDLGVW